MHNRSRDQNFVMSNFKCLLVVFIVLFAAKVRSDNQWGPWQLVSNNETYQRFRDCRQFPTDCVSQEKTSPQCLSSCTDVAGTAVDANPRFGDCRSLCYNGLHTRELVCNRNTSCSLTQLKSCVNEHHCIRGSWGEWKSYDDPTTTCNGTEKELVIRRCVQTQDFCPEELSGGSPYQLDFRNCGLSTISNTPAPVTFSTTTLRFTTTTVKTNIPASQQCTVADCRQWKSWSSWGTCSQITGKRQRSRDCQTLSTTCNGQTITQAVSSDPCFVPEEDNSEKMLVLILGSSAAGVVLIVVVAFVAVKCYRNQSVVVNQTVNAVNYQPSVSNLDSNVVQRPVSPGYKYPFDSIRSTRILMEGDSIYATVT